MREPVHAEPGSAHTVADAGVDLGDLTGGVLLAQPFQRLRAPAVGAVDTAAEVGDLHRLARGELGEGVPRSDAQHELAGGYRLVSGKLHEALDRPRVAARLGLLHDRPACAQLILVGPDLVEGDGLEAELQGGRVVAQPVVVVGGVDEARVGKLRVLVRAELAPVLPGELLRLLGWQTGGDERLQPRLGVDAVVVDLVLRQVLLAHADVVEHHPVLALPWVPPLAAEPGGASRRVVHDVADELVPGHRFGVTVGEAVALHGRVAVKVRRTGTRHRTETLVDVRPFVPARPKHAGLEGRTVDNDVVLEDAVAPAVGEHPADRHPVEHVAVHRVPAGRVVHVEAPREVWVLVLDLAVLHGLPRTTLAEAAEVVPDVVPNDIAPLRPVARAGVETTGVGGLQIGVVDDVQLDDIVVACQCQPGMRRVVDQVVAGDVADTANVDRRVVGLLEDADVMDDVVDGKVLCRRQRLAVATTQKDATTAGRVDIAAHHGALRAAVYRGAPGATVAEDALGDLAPFRVHHPHRIAVAAFQYEAPQRHVVRVLELDQVAHDRDRDVAVSNGLRRPEVDDPGLGVEIPLARAVQFLEEPLDEVAVTDPELVGGLAPQRQRLVLNGDRLNRQPVPPPVVLTEHADAAVRGACPAARVNVLRVVGERPLCALRRRLNNVRPDAAIDIRRVDVRRPRQRHPLPLEEELPERLPLEPEALQVALHDSVAVRGEPTDRGPAAEDRAFVLVRPELERRLFRAGVLSAEGQRLREVVGAPADPDGNAVGRLAGPAKGARFVAGARQRRKGCGRGTAGGLVIAGQGDEQLRWLRGSEYGDAGECQQQSHH